MKVAMVFDGLSIGGIEKVGLTYAQMLVEMGHDVTIINLQHKETAMKDMFPSECKMEHAFLPDFILPGFYLPMIRRWRWGKYAYPFFFICSFVLLHCAKLFSRLKKRQKYDIAIAFAGHIRDLTYVAYGFIAARKKIAWLHGSLGDYLIASYAYSDLYRQIKNLCVVSIDRQEYVLNTCPFLKEELSITFMPNPLDRLRPLDTDLIQRIKRQYGNFLLMISRFGKDKDQATVIRALKVLKDKYGLAIPTVFVGDGATLADNQRLADDLGLSENIAFVGSQLCVSEFYNAATLNIFSSPAEGMGMVVLEAMQAGLPVVTTRSAPGVPFLVGNDEYALTCAVGDAEEMAEKIYAMWMNSDMRESYRKQGLKRAQDFSFQATLQRLACMLDS